MLSEIRGRQISYNFTHIWSLRNKQINKEKKLNNTKQILKKQTLKYRREQNGGCQRGGGKWIK